MKERYTTWLLVILLVAQLLLIAAQLPSASGDRSHLEVVALRTVAPLSHGVFSLSSAFEKVQNWFERRRQLRFENAQLRSEITHLRLQLLRLQDVERQRDHLATALRYQPPEGLRLQVADVHYVDHESWVRTLVLYAPGAQLAVNQAVITKDGLVGRVVLATGPYAKVQLITDRAASIGAMLHRTRRQGLVQGTRSGDLELIYLPRQADIRVGDEVVTSGIDGVFPRGIAIGTVAERHEGTDLFQKIRLVSAVDFQTLDHVYVLQQSMLPANIREALPGES